MGRYGEKNDSVARWLQEGQRISWRRTVPSGAWRPDARSLEGRKHPIAVEDPNAPDALERFAVSTPSRIAVGRAGTRYLTDTYLVMRADHAIAKDAVYSEIEEAFPAGLGCIGLRSQCTDRENYLLYPDRGRRLDDESLRRLAAEGDKGCDVQIIVGDGLSAWAAERNVPELLPCLESELKAAGYSVGRPVFVRFARVGVQDHVGVTLGSRATVIFVGERPGLGTGDSLSIYIAYGPKLNQDNAEKNCISNVRALGLLPPEAARQTVEILKRAFAAGRGGGA